MPQLCPVQLCPNYAPTVPQLCPDCCPNYASTMPQLCPNYVSTDYRFADYLMFLLESDEFLILGRSSFLVLVTLKKGPINNLKFPHYLIYGIKIGRRLRYFTILYNYIIHIYIILQGVCMLDSINQSEEIT